MSKTPSGACAMTAFGMPFSRISAVSARVSMPRQARRCRASSATASRSPGGAVVGRVGDVGLEDGADGAGAGGRVEVFDVLVIGADIADMREGEGDDLAGIGRVGEDFLVAGQRGVEADFGDGAMPVAPRPRPSITVPSARTSRAVGVSVVQGAVQRSCLRRSRPWRHSYQAARRPAVERAICAAKGAGRRIREPPCTSKFSPCKAEYIGEGARAVNDGTPMSRR